MGNLFGRKKSPESVSKVSEHDKAVLQLKQQRDKLKQYQKRLEGQISSDRLLAKSLLNEGKKEKAKLLLRKKKYQESLISKTDGQLSNIERMIGDLEFAQVEQDVVRGLQVGNASLKKMHELLSVEDIEKILDETQEGIEKQREIDDLLSGGLTDQDESDVLAELDEILSAKLPEAPGAQAEDLHLPDVPEQEPSKGVQKQRVAEPIMTS